MTGTEKRVVAGFMLPSDAPLTEADHGWIELLRIIFNDRVPSPNLETVRAIRISLR